MNTLIVLCLEVLAKKAWVFRFCLGLLCFVGLGGFYLWDSFLKKKKKRRYVITGTRAFLTAQRDRAYLYQPPPAGWGPWEHCSDSTQSENFTTTQCRTDAPS